MYIFTVVTVTVMGEQCWSQTVLEMTAIGGSVLQTPALVNLDTAINVFDIYICR